MTPLRGRGIWAWRASRFLTVAPLRSAKRSYSKPKCPRSEEVNITQIDPYPEQRLDDILENIARIRDHIGKMDETAFLQDAKTIDATERCIERVAEAAQKLGERFDTDYPDLDLPALRKIGSVLRYDYDSVQPVFLWVFAKDRLAPLKAMAEEELKKLSSE